jgi:ferredoxin-NADP reductase
MKLELIERKKEAPNVESFIFRPPQTLHWRAGQYLHYVLHHEPTDTRGSDRWFTIATAPSEGVVQITTRFTPEKGSSFKSALEKLKIGEYIEASEVEGDFIVDDQKAQYVFIAGGIGVTPFRSILKEADASGVPLMVTLIYASRDKDIVFKNEFDALQQKNPNLTIHYLVAPQKLDVPTIASLVSNFATPLFYISGPEPMVESLGNALKEAGVPQEHLKQDWFPGYPAE